jgi:rare lipoprotein A
MGKILKAMLAILPAAFITTATAANAATDWRQSCSGPAYVCGGGEAPAKAKTAAKAKAPAVKSTASTTAPKAKKVAKVTKAKKATVASGDTPKAKPKKKVASKASSGGGGTSSGMASWYGGNFHGRKTANGETYNMNALTAAHKTLPFGTRVRVTNTNNGDSVEVRINDRGPFIAGRVIDLSRAAAGEIGLTNTGVAPVKVTILGKG